MLASSSFPFSFVILLYFYSSSFSASISSSAFFPSISLAPISPSYVFVTFGLSSSFSSSPLFLCKKE